MLGWLINKLYGMPEQPVKLISIDGNIGSGKSTLLNALREMPCMQGVYFLDEPISVWSTITDRDGKNILQHYYEDMKRYGLTIQATSLITRYENIRNAIASGSRCIIMERSLLSDSEIFAQTLYNEGYISSMEYKIYQKWLSIFIKSCPLDAVIYLSASPSICMDRVKQRNRAGEENISLGLLEKYHRAHLEYIDDIDNLLVIDDHKNMTRRKEMVRHFIRKVMAQDANTPKIKSKAQTSNSYTQD